MRFWTESGAQRGAVQLNCSVRAARGDSYLESISASDLDIEPFAGPGELVIRRSGTRAAATFPEEPDQDSWPPE